MGFMTTPDDAIDTAITAIDTAIEHTAAIPDTADRLAATTRLSKALQDAAHRLGPGRHADAKALREDGWTLARIAKRIGVSVAQADNLSRGARKWKGGGK